MSIQAIVPPYWLLDHANDFQQRFKVVVVSYTEQQIVLERVENSIRQVGFVFQSKETITNFITEYTIDVFSHQAWNLFQQLLSINAKNDMAIVPEQGRQKKLLVCDMDSTIVSSESLDDIADEVGLGEQIQAITASAMRGELNFRQALVQRVGLLEGVSESVLLKVAKSLQLNQGAETLIRTAKQKGIRTVLISGGFEPIVNTVAKKLGFDRYVCNQLEIHDQKITGKVLQPIVDSQTKQSVLIEECRSLRINTSDACAIGDGANDIPILQTAGLGIAYQGKPKVREATSYQISSGNLESALAFMGFYTTLT